MKKVIILQPVMAHYRRSFFKNLQNNKEYLVEFIAGNEYLDIKKCEPFEYTALKYRTLRLGAHQFFFLRKSLRHIKNAKPDIIVSGGVDFHLLHTLLIFIYFRLICKKDFFWWSHATTEKHGKFGLWIRKQFYTKASGILTYSRKGKTDLVEIGINPKKIEVLGNSINTEDYGFLKHNYKKPKAFSNYLNIVFSGRINKGKRLDILINALHLVHKRNEFDFRCNIIGGGDIAELEELTNSLELADKVWFTGPKYNNDIVEYFANADLMVYPHAIGLSLLQAFSYGIPVITSEKNTNHGPEIELLKTGTTGDFYADLNPHELAKAIVKWNNTLQTSREKIANSCIKRIHDFKYLPEEMSKTFFTFICLNSNKTKQA